MAVEESAAGSFAAVACPDGQDLGAGSVSVRHMGSAAAVDAVVVAEEYDAGEQVGAVLVCYLVEGSVVVVVVVVVVVAAAASGLLEARTGADHQAEGDNALAGVRGETWAVADRIGLPKEAQSIAAGLEGAALWGVRISSYKRGV